MSQEVNHYLFEVNLQDKDYIRSILYTYKDDVTYT